MNILLSTDNNYLQHCAATISSILTNNTDVTFYVFSTDISEKSKVVLSTLVNKYCSSIFFIHIENELLERFPMSEKASDHISIATYLRLFVDLKLPMDLEKIIYLDCDIIVRKSLVELWNLNMNSYALAAVYQYNQWALDCNTFSRLGYPESYGYFNAGVLLINLEYWRLNDVSSRLFSYIEKNYENIISHDQDVLNAVLHNEVYPLSCKWNLLPFFFEKDLDKFVFPRNLDYKNEVSELLIDPFLIHFVHKPKPWEYGCIHPWKKEYFIYLENTMWKNWRPKFSMSKFVEYNLLPRIFRIRRNILNHFKLPIISKY